MTKFGKKSLTLPFARDLNSINVTVSSGPVERRDTRRATNTFSLKPKQCPCYSMSTGVTFLQLVTKIGMQISQLLNVFPCLTLKSVISISSCPLRVFPHDVPTTENDEHTNEAACRQVERVSFVVVGRISREVRPYTVQEGYGKFRRTYQMSSVKRTQ